MERLPKHLKLQNVKKDVWTVYGIYIDRAVTDLSQILNVPVEYLFLHLNHIAIARWACLLN